MPSQTLHAPTEPPPTRRIIGCMTGTSLDGIDCALVEIQGHGLEMRPRFVRGRSSGLGELAPRLRALAEQKPMTAGDIARLSREFALLHAREVNALLDDECGAAKRGVSGGGPTAATMRRCDLIAVHGQTVFHQPPVSWQLFNPAVLAYETGIDVVTDLRAADLAAGGQGAPITPLADWIWLRSPTERRVVLNLGGFANATVLPRDSGPESINDIRGMDICACNHVLDAAARAGLGKPYDETGASAAAGRLEGAARDELLAILSRQSSGGRSLGTGDEVVGAGGWVERWRLHVNGEDLCATACAAVGEVIRAALGRHDATRVLAAGGGAMNCTLLAHIGASVERTDEHGLPGSFREAAEMAALGALCGDGVPITLPAVTAGKGPKPVAGVWAFAGAGRSHHQS